MRDMLQITLDDRLGRELSIIEHLLDKALILLLAMVELVVRVLDEGDDSQSGAVVLRSSPFA